MSDNVTRAGRALDCIHGYGEGGDKQDAEMIFQWMTDLICDLRHLADQRDFEWDAVLHRAYDHYECEIAEEAEFDLEETRKIANTNWRQVTDRAYVHELLAAACDEIEALRARAES